MTNNIDKELLRIYKDILENGEPRNDRTGVGTLATFFQTISFDASKYAPVSQMRPIAVKGAIAEAIWILKGRTDIEWLEEHKVKYWREWADKDGKLGKVYGYQMRNFESKNNTCDQLKTLIDNLKSQPTGRRHLISLWNPANLSEQQLPPCHFLSQYYLDNNNTLHQIVMQRSCDFLLGVPHDLIIYKVFLDLIAQTIGAKSGMMNYVFGDSHIYKNHIPAAKWLIENKDKIVQPSEVVFEYNPIKTVFDIEPEDITVVNYSPNREFTKQGFDTKVAV